MNKLALLLFLLLLSGTAAALNITEILYNPNVCSNSYCEFIELYNPTNTSINLTQWKLCNDQLLPGYIENQTLQANNSGILPPYTFAIITDGGSGTLAYQNYNISNTSLAFHTSSSTLCKGLSNAGKTITLTNNRTINVTYQPLAENSHSIQFFDASWCSGMPTPGYSNFCSTPPEQEILAQEDSSLKILDAPSSAEFGESISIKIQVHKGDTSRYAVYAYVEKESKRVSQKTTMHFKEKSTTSYLTIPIQLKPNCNKKYDDGRYDIVLKGLGKEEERSIKLKGGKASWCKTKTTHIDDSTCKIIVQNTTKENTTCNPIIINKTIKERKWSTIYESTSFKSTKLLPYLIIITLLLLTTILVLTKDF